LKIKLSAKEIRLIRAGLVALKNYIQDDQNPVFDAILACEIDLSSIELNELDALLKDLREANNV
jgi:hypothetical protein